MTTWRKSTYSGSQTDCVEVGNGGGVCVEAGNLPGHVLVRDTTQHGSGPVLRVSPAAWRRFTASIR